MRKEGRRKQQRRMIGKEGREERKEGKKEGDEEDERR